MLALLLFSCSRDPDQPPEVPYDQVACAHCGMLVSDPEYAGALVERDGTTRYFDDAACVLLYVAEHAPPVRHLWFHHADHWYHQEDVAFSLGGLTPMGSGLVAVPKGTPGALSVGEASGRVLAPRKAAR